MRSGLSCAHNQHYDSLIMSTLDIGSSIPKETTSHGQENPRHHHPHRRMETDRPHVFRRALGVSHHRPSLPRTLRGRYPILRRRHQDHQDHQHHQQQTRRQNHCNQPKHRHLPSTTHHRARAGRQHPPHLHQHPPQHARDARRRPILANIRKGTRQHGHRRRTETCGHPRLLSSRPLRSNLLQPENPQL